MHLRTILIVILTLVAFLFSPDASARSRRRSKAPPFYIILKPHPDAAKVTAPLSKGKLSVIEKEYDAKVFCNESSVANPEQINVYALNGRLDRVLVVCGGLEDGETNVATIFYPDKEPVKKEIKPPKGSSKVTERQLQDAFKKLVAGASPANDHF